MDQVRLGIIGAGPIVEKKHLPALAEVPEIAVLAACRRSAEHLHRVADRFRIPDRHTDYRALLDDERIDAVLIAAGPPAQTQIVIDAAAAGKHILVEKPLAETSSEARAMCVAVEAAKIHFQVAFNKRFYAGYRRARHLMDAGDLGTPTGLDARFWFPGGRRDGLLHNGVHFLDLAQFFLGPARTVFARRCAPAGVAGDTVAVSIGFDSGAVGSLLLSSLGSWDHPNEYVSLVGSNGTALTVDNGHALRVFRKGDGRPAELYESTLSVHWWSGHDEQGFIPQLRVFAQKIRDGAGAGGDLGPLTAGPGDGLRSLTVLEATRRSIAEGRLVRVPSPDIA
jgi:predicted dehydrogenase